MNLNHSACLPGKRCMLVSLKSAADLSRECAIRKIGIYFSRPTPMPADNDLFSTLRLLARHKILEQ